MSKFRFWHSKTWPPIFLSSNWKKLYIYIYIYIEREREREKTRHGINFLFLKKKLDGGEVSWAKLLEPFNSTLNGRPSFQLMRVYIYIYIYIYDP